jgi:hypothetical protein
MNYFNFRSKTCDDDLSTKIAQNENNLNYKVVDLRE